MMRDDPHKQDGQTRPGVAEGSPNAHSSEISYPLVPLVSLVLVGFIFVFIALIDYYGEHLARLDQNITGIDPQSTKMRLNSEMMDIARMRARLTAQLIDTADVFEQDEMLIELERLAGEYAEKRIALLQLDISEQEQVILDSQRDIVIVTLPTQREIVRLAMSDDPRERAKAEGLLYDVFLPRQKELIDTLSALIALEQQQVKRIIGLTRESVDKLERQSKQYLGIILLVSCIVSVVVIYQVFRTHSALRRTRNQLEATVSERTEELLSAQNRLHVILNTIPDSVYWKDRRGYFVGANDNFIKNAGYSSVDQLVGKTDWDMPWASSAQEIQRDDSLVIEGGMYNLYREVAFENEDGRTEWLECSKVPLYDQDNNCIGLLGVDRDITERKRGEVVNAEREKAQVAADTKARFLANMSHEIRTPLNGVIGLALMGSKQDDPSRMNELFEMIMDSGQHLLYVVNDILDLSKIEAGKLSILKSDFDLYQMITRTGNLFRHAAEDKGLALDVDIAADVPRWVNSDEIRLRQILSNLISNAIKFTEEGFIRVAVSVSEENIVFRVQDSGTGISEDLKPRLFNAFEQEDSSSSRRYGGTGLGLAICRTLAGLLDGDIDVDSVPGDGSCFTVSLPLSEAEGPEDQGAESPDLSSQDCLSGLRILVAEDVEINRIVLEDMLREQGADVSFAEDGREAVDRFSGEHRSEYDIVLMDIEMPRMDGYEAGQLIRDAAPEVPIIGLTAHALEETRQKILDAGMQEHVTKPVDEKSLVSTILKYVA